MKIEAQVELSLKRSSESQISEAQRTEICWTNYPANLRRVGIGRGGVGYFSFDKLNFNLLCPFKINIYLSILLAFYFK
jgi:hypothetical protein